ncbi:hypothetical protein [Gracilibacillus sp. JCM 18860]|uniref:hypothetical protein n=1 Tax=Gracilibacillus sp. JCM 18860 TaxID=1306159 RepID=UPI003260EC50
MLSDRLGSRRKVMLVYMIGISIGLLLMGFINSSWPLAFAVAITIITSMFIQGAEGATFAVIPPHKEKNNRANSWHVRSIRKCGIDCIFNFIYLC